MNNPFSILLLLFHVRRPSRLSDMPAKKDAFWIGKSYEALTFFGTVLTHTQEAADHMNSRYDELKNHEMIHLRQARSTHDSWLCFYLLYAWYYLRALPYNRQLKNAAYRLNPFEMEAYAHMNDLDYVRRRDDGANGWREFARMTVRERLEYYKQRHRI